MKMKRLCFVMLGIIFSTLSYANVTQQIEELSKWKPMTTDESMSLEQIERVSIVEDEQSTWGPINTGYKAILTGHPYWKVRWTELNGSANAIVTVWCVDATKSSCTMNALGEECVVNECPDGIEIKPMNLNTGYVSGELLGCDSPAVVDGKTCSSASKTAISFGLVSLIASAALF